MSIYKINSGPRGFILPDDPPTPQQIIRPETFNATTSMVQFPAADHQVLSKQTIMAASRPVAAGEGSRGYIIAHAYIDASQGIRLFHDATADPRWYFGADNGVNNLFPAASTNPSPYLSYGKIQVVAATWDGSANANNIYLYRGTDAQPLFENTYDRGSGDTVWAPVGMPITIGNRGGGDRTFNGDIFWVARWNRILLLDELRKAQFNGAESVPDGLTFHYVNGKERIYGMIPWIRTDITYGAPSPYVAMLT